MADPKHLAPDADRGLRWWAVLPRQRVMLGVAATLLAVPVMVLDNLPHGSRRAEAVEVVDTSSSTTSTTVAVTTTPTTLPTTTTVAPTTTATTAPPVTAAALVAAPVESTTTTARPRPTTTTTAPRPTTTTAPAPTTTAPPAPPPPAGSVEATIRARFGADGDAAVSVARCESGLNPNAQSPGGYYGLFQIGRSHAARFQQVTGRSFDSAWMDPDANSQYAKYLFDQSGWSVWGCKP